MSGVSMHTDLNTQVAQIVTFENINSRATELGYNLQYNFLPGEFEHLIREITSFVLSHLNLINYEMTDDELRGKVGICVKEECAKVCQVRESNLPELDLSGQARQWIASWLRWF